MFAVEPHPVNQFLLSPSTAMLGEDQDELSASRQQSDIQAAVHGLVCED